ncbi:hypothetical protein [Streptomyces katrae]|uniref:hypothetical protein n=1 Tax=Streptomyces katrae TaxID=68223 RepID=UPI00131D8B93|nr:hypothetical protein [Streptomyces katrae]
MQPTETSSGTSQATLYPNTDAGFRKLIMAVRFGEDVVASLEPNSADYAAVFEPEFAAKAEKMYEEWIWSKPPATLDVAREKTEIKVAKATTDDLRNWPNQPSEEFPLGYEKVAPYLKPGTTIYRWKYLEPGEVLGKAYDGMAYVNGRWVWFPKLWRVLD